MRTNNPVEINLQNEGIAQEYPGAKSIKPVYFLTCLQIKGIEPIARHSLLSDE
jgi:hypothetical protein